MINSVINAAILTAINSLQAEANIPATVSLKSLCGALQSVNATCQTVSLQELEAEMLHILLPKSIAVAGMPPGYVDWGYVQADLHALS